TAAATDGSKVAQYILAEDVDASTADTKAVVYTTGEFLTGALVVGDDDTVAAHEDELHKCSIFMTSAQ
ncbi:MAG: head decoration protein, partial [Acidaminococcaceae bacterium]